MFDLATLERADRAFARLAGRTEPPVPAAPAAAPRPARPDLAALPPEALRACPHLRALAEAAP